MWEERFAASDDYVFGTAPAQFLIDHQSYLTSGESALSVADGEGRNSVFMAEQGMEVTALEFAPSAIVRARDLAKARNVNVTFLEADILKDSWPARDYDVVAGVFIQFVGPEARALQFQKMKQATTPGGLVMLHGYTPKQLEFGTGGPSAVENLYTENMLQDAFTGWDILECRAYERTLDEGKGHSGKSALIDLVARKPT
ncbi:class I SAM-dependent methyltransferase [Shimia thalassica]|uniref:class I SAM-dependent methyltransferase n=1 Tax=Shimia thalassica TaxID=1715693 RepID=UPI0026E3AB0A|nr:class I SAM-dependent methyltransferase [Shimia thalassica]MDO6521033.1 class I SAM-dependent methyltransferase [Shimia thalassica]